MSKKNTMGSVLEESCPGFNEAYEILSDAITRCERSSGRAVSMAMLYLLCVGFVSAGHEDDSAAHLALTIMFDLIVKSAPNKEEIDKEIAYHQLRDTSGLKN